MEVPINTKEKTVSIDKSAAHFGPVWLAPGISKLNAFTLLYVSYATIGLLVLITISTAYVLNEILQIPPNEQGVISGMLVLWSELSQILIFLGAGIAADRIGRRPVLCVPEILF